MPLAWVLAQFNNLDWYRLGIQHPEGEATKLRQMSMGLKAKFILVQKCFEIPVNGGGLRKVYELHIMQNKPWISNISGTLKSHLLILFSTHCRSAPLVPAPQASRGGNPGPGGCGAQARPSENDSWAGSAQGELRIGGGLGPIHGRWQTQLRYAQSVESVAIQPGLPLRSHRD